MPAGPRRSFGRRPVLPGPEGARDHAGPPASRRSSSRPRHRHRRLRGGRQRNGLAEALDAIGGPAVLKTRRFGYDGKGQTRSRAGDAGRGAASSAASRRSSRASSDSSARSRSSPRAAPTARRDAIDLVENVHSDHILRPSLRAGRRDAGSRRRGAARSPRASLRGLDYVGVLAIELFVTRTGRTCWSTRWRRGCTIPATGRSTARGASSSSTSARSRAGRWRPSAARDAVEMTNLIGDESTRRHAGSRAGRAPAPLRQSEAAAGRKMGHVTRVLGDAGS